MLKMKGFQRDEMKNLHFFLSHGQVQHFKPQPRGHLKLSEMCSSNAFGAGGGSKCVSVCVGTCTSYNLFLLNRNPKPYDKPPLFLNNIQHVSIDSVEFSLLSLFPLTASKESIFCP